MILEYHRPDQLQDAVHLLERKTPPTIPLAGGTIASHPDHDCAVVDLQNLGLNHVTIEGLLAEIGAMTTYQQLMDWEEAPAVLVEAAHRSATFNLRQQATIGGAVASRHRFSPLLAALLALDTHIVWAPGEMELALGEWLPIRNQFKPGVLITAVKLPVNVKTAMEVINRSPADAPQLLVCGCKWASGRIRIVAMLKDQPPFLVSDGRDTKDIELGSINADRPFVGYSQEYIISGFSTLIRRVLTHLVD